MKRARTRRVSFFVPMLTAALILVGWPVASAGRCLPDGAACRTDKSCCTLSCVKPTPTKNSFGTCGLFNCCVQSSPMGAFDTCMVETAAQCSAQGGIAQGLGLCSPSPCPPQSTTTSSTTTTSIMTTTSTTLG